MGAVGLISRGLIRPTLKSIERRLYALQRRYDRPSQTSTISDSSQQRSIHMQVQATMVSVVLKEMPLPSDDGSAGCPWAQLAPNAPYTHSVSVFTDRRPGSTKRLGDWPRLATAH